MLVILIGLFVGWLWSLVHLDSLFNNLLGFTITQYYLMWFLMGVIVWTSRLFTKKDKK
jgi:hypothetical protein